MCASPEERLRETCGLTIVVNIVGTHVRAYDRRECE